MKDRPTMWHNGPEFNREISRKRWAKEDRLNLIRAIAEQRKMRQRTETLDAAEVMDAVINGRIGAADVDDLP